MTGVKITKRLARMLRDSASVAELQDRLIRAGASVKYRESAILEWERQQGLSARPRVRTARTVSGGLPETTRR